MTRQIKTWFAAVTLAVFMTGCGGGGGGGGSSNNDSGSDTESEVAVSGMASKGPINGGTIKVYELKTDGSTGSLLGTTTTATDGQYSVTVKNTGNMLIEVTGGTYSDEATDSIVSMGTTKLRTALTGISGDVTVAVTPLTELAVLNAGTLTKTNIEAANSLVGSLAGGIDIIQTLPADVTSINSQSATQSQREYGLMLAVISQMSKDSGKSVSDIITELQTDIADGKIDDTSTIISALGTFLGSSNNMSGISGLSSTALDDAILAGGGTSPNAGKTDLEKAKALVSDTRNTVLSIYNYQGVGVPGIMDTPFNNLAEELETKIEPELTLTVDRLNWILQSASYGIPGEYDDLSTGLHLSLTTTSATNDLGFTEASYTISNISTGATLSSGSLTVQNNTSGQITSGTFSGTLRTTSGGTVSASLNYSATVSNGYYADMTLTGSMSAADSGSTTSWLSLDFSESGRKLYATFAKVPDSTEPGDIYPTSIVASARITTGTAQMDGDLNISSIVWANKGYEDWGTCVGEWRPAEGTFTGSFEELSNGSTTGVKFSGTITGDYANASTYDGCTYYDSSTNFSQWNASFDGKIEAPSRPTITAFLKATQSEYQKVSLDANYKRTNTDGTVVYLSGSGTLQTYASQYYWDTYNVLTAYLTNQDGMVVSISNDDSKSEDERFSGTITTSGGSKMADLYTTNDVPMVKYTDNYVETIF